MSKDPTLQYIYAWVFVNDKGQEQVPAVIVADGDDTPVYYPMIGADLDRMYYLKELLDKLAPPSRPMKLRRYKSDEVIAHHFPEQQG